MLKLRPYQTAAIQAVIREWDNGNLATLLTMATGGGKTIIFLSLLDAVMRPGDRALIVAHRRDLITQPSDRINQYYPALDAGIVMADQNDTGKQITIATIQTLRAKGRVEQIMAHGAIDYLVIDEAHHATSDSYLGVIETLQAYNPSLKHLGVTATPIRADGDGLLKVYQSTAGKWPIDKLIRAGYLAPVRWLGIQTGVSIAGVKTQAGDFVKSQLKNVYETDNVFDLVVETHQKYAADRQAIAFTVTVDGAYALADKFNDAGIKARAADAKTKPPDRARMLDDFRAENIDVICNVGLYTEGLDLPQVSCIHGCRPTQSDGLYMQMIGRALRLYPGKKDALVLDYAPKEKRNLAMMGDVLLGSLPKDENGDAPGPGGVAGEIYAGFTFDGSLQRLVGDPEKIIARQLNYLDVSQWSWYRQDGYMSLGLGKASDDIERTLVISPPTDSEMKLYLVAKRPGQSRWRAYHHKSGSFDVLMDWCDEYADKRGNAVLAAKSKRWREDPPTEPQINFARRIGAKMENMNKGQLGQSITHRLAVLAIGNA